MESVQVFAGRDLDDALRPDRNDALVVKWLGAGVVPDSDVAVPHISAGLDDHDAAPRRTMSLPPRRLTIKAAVGSEDRKGDVIDPTGWELQGYRRNPVFLWAHDRSRPPIGKSQRVWVENDALYADIEFAPTDFATEIASLYARGFMRGVSVGFLPLQTDIRRSSNGRRGYLYRRQELLEISAVPVPMHDDALALGEPLPSKEKTTDDIDAERDDVEELRAGVRRLMLAAGFLVD